MNSKWKLNSKTLQLELERLRTRIGEKQRALESKNEENLFQEFYFEMFEDALSAAGIASSLERKEDEIKYLLSVAATSVVYIYRLKGTVVSRIMHLPNFKDEIFVDNSLTNPWTFVRGLYAALIADEDEVLKELLALEPHASQEEHVTVSPLVEKYVSSLKNFLSGRKDSFSKEIYEIMAQWANCSEPDEQFWVRQAIVLKHISERNKSGFSKALESLAAAHENFYSNMGHQYDPDYSLAISVRGLKALAMRVDNLFAVS